MELLNIIILTTIDEDYAMLNMSSDITQRSVAYATLLLNKES